MLERMWSKGNTLPLLMGYRYFGNQYGSLGNQSTSRHSYTMPGTFSKGISPYHPKPMVYPDSKVCLDWSLAKASSKRPERLHSAIEGSICRVPQPLGRHPRIPWIRGRKDWMNQRSQGHTRKIQHTESTDQPKWGLRDQGSY